MVGHLRILRQFCHCEGEPSETEDLAGAGGSGRTDGQGGATARLAAQETVLLLFRCHCVFNESMFCFKVLKAALTFALV